MNDLYVGAYWGARKESVDLCADRLMALLNGVTVCGDLFSQWYEKGGSRREAMATRIDIQSRESVAKLLEAGRNRTDVDKAVIDSLGFSIGIWNGQPDEQSASLGIVCGCYSNNPNLRNSVVLELPENAGAHLDRDRCFALLTTVIKSWEPEWAGVISRSSRIARNYKPGRPFLDWMLYVDRADVKSERLPASASATLVGGGTILVTQDQPVNPTDTVALANLKRIAEIAGLDPV